MHFSLIHLSDQMISNLANSGSTKSRKIGNFSLFNLLNNTRDGPVEIYTGLNGTASVFSQVRSHHGTERYSQWRSEACNLINGSDLLAWPGQIWQVSAIKAFVPGACRSMELRHEKDLTYKGQWDLAGSNWLLLKFCFVFPFRSSGQKIHHRTIRIFIPGRTSAQRLLLHSFHFSVSLFGLPRFICLLRRHSFGGL